VRLETDGDFLEGKVSEADPLKLLNTYGDDLDSRLSNHEGAKTDVNATNSGGALVDSDNELADNETRARIVVAAIEPGEDGVALSAKEAEGVRHVGGGPLLDDFGDGTGEGHSTSSEDGEDGGEAHDEEG
jgi:hypothetical protein